MFESGDYSEHSLSQLPQQAIIGILASFLTKLATTPQSETKGPLMARTLRNYLISAVLFLNLFVTNPFTIYRPPPNDTKLTPMLEDIIKHREKWQQPMPKREAYTFAMFSTMSHLVISAIDSDPKAVFGQLATVFDWVRLGIFTGCRACEYAQTLAKRGDYSRVPNSAAAGKWSGTPIAFIWDDFTFYDANMCLVPSTFEALLCSPHRAHELHIRYRFDKSGRTFVIKKYRRGHGLLCAVDAAISILRRAHLLGVPTTEPLGVFQPPNSDRYTFLKSDDIIATMRAICIQTYPNPNHYMRINIQGVVSHSNRVTAAVVLRSMGWDIDAIASRLRWKRDSVEHYLRECDFMVDDFTQAAFRGAHNL